MSLRKFHGLLACCAATALFGLGDQRAQAQVDVEAGPVQVQVGQREGRTSDGVARRASEVTGLTVKNDSGAELGHVEDLVLDLNSGQIRYAAVSYGGFLGVGDKLFAVPWREFEVRRVDDEEFLLLNVDKEVLTDAPGFNQDDWPDVASPDWSQAIDDYYDAHRDQ